MERDTRRVAVSQVKFGHRSASGGAWVGLSPYELDCPRLSYAKGFAVLPGRDALCFLFVCRVHLVIVFPHSYCCVFSRPDKRAKSLLYGFLPSCVVVAADVRISYFSPPAVLVSLLEGVSGFCRAKFHAVPLRMMRFSRGFYPIMAVALLSVLKGKGCARFFSICCCCCCCCKVSP